MEQRGSGTGRRAQRPRSAADGGGALARDALIGAIAGTAATVAMTLAADALFRRLPARERYPLPPRELTERALAAAGAREVFDEPGLQAATLASHFGFGAASGALYGLLARPSSRGTGRLGGAPAALEGVGFAIGVWTASYFGWVPAFGLLRSASSHPARRNALMLSVHLVWGSSLGLVAQGLSRALKPIAGGELRDR